MNNQIKEIISKLVITIEKDNYKGWDPYDALNSKFLSTISGFSSFLQRAIIHLIKLFPINLRPILGVSKGYNPTAVSLFLDSHINIYNYSKDEELIKKIKKLKNLLIKLSLINNNTELGWGRNFKFITVKETHEVDKPLTFLNAKLGHSLVKYYKITKEENVINELQKIINTILIYGKVYTPQNMTFIGYAAVAKPRYIFNASIMSARLFLEYLQLINKNDTEIAKYNLKELSIDIIKTIINAQNKDGSWDYGYAYDMKAFGQRDFHQGFVIDSILDIINLLEDSKLKDDLTVCYQKGLNFMIDNQISQEGYFKWRHPKKYPIDIHNQAQGIISFSKAININKTDKLDTLVKYVINNFWNNKKGYFYYQKWSFFTNKIPYIRWSQGWMLYALTKYQLNNNNNNVRNTRNHK